MYIDFKSRFKNPVFVVSFAAAIVAFVYQLAALFGVVPPIAQDDVMAVVGIVVNFLIAIGVLVNPITPGIGDTPKIDE